MGIIEAAKLADRRIGNREELLERELGREGKCE